MEMEMDCDSVGGSEIEGSDPSDIRGWGFGDEEAGGCGWGEILGAREGWERDVEMELKKRREKKKGMRKENRWL